MENLELMKLYKNLSTFLTLLLVLLLIIPSISGIFNQQIQTNNNTFNKNNNDGEYQGFLKIYLVEPVSRWDDSDGVSYHFGFLQYLFDEPLSIFYNQTFIAEKTIDISSLEYTDIEKENIMFIATVFNGNNHTRCAYPPSQNPFEAYYVDATAACYPDDQGHNLRNENFTHTVFVEEGTANWCHNCPPVSETINRVYNSNKFPFYFVSLVSDKNTIAEQRLRQDFNILGYPTLFIDGGNDLIVGNKENMEELFRTKIEKSGKRDVHNLNLSISTTWNNSKEFSITVSITNQELKNADTSNPIISIAHPQKGIYFNNNFLISFPKTLIFGNIDVIINASDENSGIQHVKIYINDELKTTLNAGTNRWTWDELSFGRYEITAVATDNVGNQKNEELIVWKFL